MLNKMKVILTITAFSLITLSVFSWPITPQTLRKLIAHSEYIVIAKVDNPIIRRQPTEYSSDSNDDVIAVTAADFFGDGFADLQVLEILKGQIDEVKITVEYQAGMMCPAPARYPDKGTVIAFLMREDSATTYYTYGLSYGSKIMTNEEELEAYKARIIEYLDILKLKNERTRNSRTAEWLVRCAENRYARWDGAYELSRTQDFASTSSFSDEEDFREYLTKKQKARLRDTFFSTDTIGYDELFLINFIDEPDYQKMRQHLLNSLPFADYYVAEDIMSKIVETSSSVELKNILTQVIDMGYFKKDEEEKRKLLIQEFIDLAKKE